MKLKFKIVVLFTLIFKTAFVFAGGMEGGGGKSVVCRDNSGKISNAIVLDLYEAQIFRGKTITFSSQDYMEQVDSALIKIGNGRGQDYVNFLLEKAHSINSNIRILPDSTKLKDINDANEVIIPEKCNLEQLANYINSALILINGEIWSSLNETNKAALIVHETIYSEFRKFGALTSTHARWAVGAAFLGLTTEFVSEGVPEDAILCKGENIKYWIYPDTDPSFNIVQFDSSPGILMLTKTLLKVKSPLFSQMGSIDNYDGEINYSLLEEGLRISFYDLNTGTTINPSYKRIVDRYWSTKCTK